MSILRPAGTQWRTPQYGKNLIVSSWRGLLRVQRWPKPRGPSKTFDEETRRVHFRLIQGLIKRLQHWEVQDEREAIKTHNQTHRGQRGSAAIRLRDWQTQRLYGRGLALTTDEGITFYPPAVHRDASKLLDHITATPPQMMVRDVDNWTGLTAGTQGQALTAGPSGQACAWQDIP